MPTRKISQDTQLSQVVSSNSLYLPIVDKREADAANQNKSVTVQNLIGTNLATFSSGFTIPILGNVTYVMTNSAIADQTVTLPPTSAESKGLFIRFFNKSTQYKIKLVSSDVNFAVGSFPSTAQLDVAPNGGGVTVIYDGTEWIYF